MKNEKDQINGYSRVINALMGKLSDRIPFTLMLSLYGSHMTDCPLTEYYSNAEAYFNGQVAVIEAFDPDIITLPFVMAFDGEAFGSTIKHFEKSPPLLKKPVISSHLDIKNLKIPAVDSGSKAFILESCRKLASKYKNEKFIAGITLSCVDSPAMIMGIEGWLDTIMFSPEEAMLMLEKTSRYFIDYSNALFDAGVDVVVISCLFCNPTIITGEIAEYLTTNVLHKALNEIKGPVVIHHGGAIFGDFLPYFVNLPNVVGFILDQRDDFNYARTIVGNKLLFGNLNITTIAHKTPEIVRKECLKILDDRKDDPHFIFSNAGPDLIFGTPFNNIMTVCDVVKSYKKMYDSKELPIDHATEKSEEEKIICIACGVFKNELNSIKKETDIDVPIIYLDSMLHMQPINLEKILNAQVEKYKNNKIILVYGDCHARMNELEKNKNIIRTPGINCCNILLSCARYNELRKEGAFILIGDWLNRWEEVFRDELGFTKAELAKTFMQEMHTKLVYLDSKQEPVPHKKLMEISEYCGLPYFIESGVSENLSISMKNIIKQFGNEQR